MIAKIALLVLMGTATAGSLVAVRQARLQAVAQMTAALKQAHADDIATQRVRTEIMHLASLDRAWDLQASMGETVSIPIPRWDAPEHVLVLASDAPIPEREIDPTAGLE